MGTPVEIQENEAESPSLMETSDPLVLVVFASTILWKIYSHPLTIIDNNYAQSSYIYTVKLKDYFNPAGISQLH